MDAKPWSFLSVLEPKSCYEVPLYQRQYVWDQEHQWEPLWEDISRKFEEAFTGVVNAPPHFLGAIVVDQEPTRMGELKRHLIIDGQQRLITFQIFLSAFRDFSKKNSYVELSDELDKFIFNTGMMANPEVEKYKIWPTERDRLLFDDIISTGSLDDLMEKYPLVRRKYQRFSDPRPGMVEAYIFFYNKISEFFNASLEDSPYNGLPLNSRLETAFHTLEKALQVVVIELSQSDDAQVIFETLNARGEPLLPSDLLRNFIFLRARQEGLKSQEVYESYWKEFDGDFWRNEMSQGRITRPRSDLFMQHFLTAQTTRDISVKHLYVEYKNWVIKEHPFPTVKKELEAISSYKDSFRDLIEPSRENPVSHLSGVLRLFDMSTAYPPLMIILNEKIDDEDLVTIEKVFESYILRRAVAGLSTKNLNRIFLGVASFIKSNGVSLENVTKYLSTRTGDSGVWPSDDKFFEGWMNNPLDAMLGHSQIVHCLLHLNEKFRTSKNEEVNITGSLTLEHLMPSDWIEHWPLPDGEQGLSWAEMYQAEEGNARAEATKLRNSKVSTMGNLTIITGPLNSSFQNKQWSIKKPELQKYSLLPINQKLWELEEWNESTIEKRGKELFEKAKVIWIPPNTY